MPKSKIIIKSEISSQRIDAQPNPMLPKVIEYIKTIKPNIYSVGDQGCGKLRHLEILRNAYRYILLIDTKLQLESVHTLLKFKMSIYDYVKTHCNGKGNNVKILTNDEFSKTKTNLEMIYTIATFDVLIKNTRVELIKSANKNLVKGGYYCLIIPRNDSSILSRCKDNKYKDGYVFAHHNTHTFFVNYRDHKPLIKLVESHKFVLHKDLSNYRNIVLIFEK